MSDLAGILLTFLPLFLILLLANGAERARKRDTQDAAMRAIATVENTDTPVDAEAALVPPPVPFKPRDDSAAILRAMAYLLLGSVFLTIGSMASTVREVQTISMPVSMSQLMIFFFATYAAAMPGTGISLAAELIPFSSPFAMLARAAQDGAVLPHVMAVAWQVMWVAIFVHFGSRLFRRRVMKSGPQQARTKKGKGQPAAA